MNIFYLDPDPKVCAEMHCDKHVVKMILEYAQLLSTAHRVIDGDPVIELNTNGRKVKRWHLADKNLDTRLFAATHVNHPCSQWVRQNDSNYRWLRELLWNLMIVYRKRYGKEHSVWERCLAELKDPPKYIVKGVMSKPPQAMPNQYKVDGDPVQAYRNYYCFDKARFAKWRDGMIPYWFTPLHNGGSVDHAVL